jgi:CRISPR-associated endonuclease/helicase Cas3
MDDSVPLYFRYWGKAEKEGERYLLPYHCLDVAAVGRWRIN